MTGVCVCVCVHVHLFHVSVLGNLQIPAVRAIRFPSPARFVCLKRMPKELFMKINGTERGELTLRLFPQGAMLFLRNIWILKLVRVI